MNTSIFYILRAIFSHIHRKRKLQFIQLNILMLLVSIVDLVSIGLVLPFLSILLNPQIVYDNSSLKSVFIFLNIDSPTDLALPMTFIFVTAIIISGIMRLTLLYLNTKFSYSTGSDLASKVYNLTLHQPYYTHVSTNTSNLINVMVSKVNGLIQNVIMASMNLISSLTMVTISLAILIILYPKMTLILVLFFSSVYGMIYYLSKGRIEAHSKIASVEHSRIVKLIMEGMGAIRDILLDGNQSFYTRLYLKSDIPLRKSQGFILFISSWPRFFVEMIGMILLTIFAYRISMEAEGLSNYLPLFGVFVLGAQKLLPLVQQIYLSYSSIIGYKFSAIDTLDFLDQKILQESSNSPNLNFETVISLVNISYRYDKFKTDWILRDLNLKINKGDKIGIIGPTGCGKSTLIDIIMGLLTPEMGEVIIDKIKLNKYNLRNWQGLIAHVPQNIYLADCSIEENIAFGIPVSEIDKARVMESAKKAKIFDFIDEMPLKFKTIVGERGSKISGGQRQRIGIARALYKNAKVLILDEATNSLDNSTEYEVMQSLFYYEQDITVITIAHQLAALKNCNKIFEITNGRANQIK